MRKFKVTIGTEYIQGYLKYGHLEGIVEADSIEDIRKEIYEYADELHLVVDDYAVEDYSIDIDDINIEEADDEV